VKGSERGGFDYVPKVQRHAQIRLIAVGGRRYA
jgi:hypothetical protein